MELSWLEKESLVRNQEARTISELSTKMIWSIPLQIILISKMRPMRSLISPPTHSGCLTLNSSTTKTRLMFEYFYNEIFRSVIIGFGSMFNGIEIQHKNESDNSISTLKVPLVYGPTQKFLARIEQQAEI